ncbi:MAG TPA: hypothetical protein VGT82_05940 [Ktedonobacteraceae bacterium]|nr:hypothetical protein [Ktedonobacteraceae bacterium]
MTSHPISIDAGTMKLSGRFLPAANGQPRALLVAVHGGSYVEECIVYLLNQSRM